MHGWYLEQKGPLTHIINSCAKLATCIGQVPQDVHTQEESQVYPYKLIQVEPLGSHWLLVTVHISPRK